MQRDRNILKETQARKKPR